MALRVHFVHRFGAMTCRFLNVRLGSHSVRATQSSVWTPFRFESLLPYIVDCAIRVIGSAKSAKAIDLASVTAHYLARGQDSDFVINAFNPEENVRCGQWSVEPCDRGTAVANPAQSGRQRALESFTSVQYCQQEHEFFLWRDHLDGHGRATRG
jgi:hypothetical protein